MKILIICAGWGSWIKPFINTLDGGDYDVYALNVGNDDFEGLDKNKSFYLKLNPRELYGDMSKETYYKYKQIVDSVTPDIIHIYGTENNMGLLVNYIHDVPIVINIQGLLTDITYFKAAYLDYNVIRKYRSLKNYLGYGGFITDKMIARNGQAEKDIIRNNRYFIGRTSMDRNVIYFLNKQSLYYVGEELLRPAFYQNTAAWNLENTERYSIFMPSGFNPIKGMHLAIEAVSLLKQDYPDIKLYIPGVSPAFLEANFLWRYSRGEMYTNYLKHVIEEYGLRKNIILTGRLSAEEMVDYMLKCHVYLSPSVTDNSPNSVGEATMLGMPIVASFVGGVPSFLQDKDSCLFANSGDPFMMAGAIKSIFDNEELAVRLGKNAVKVAQSRHDRDTIRLQYSNIYNSVIYDFKNNRK